MSKKSSKNLQYERYISNNAVNQIQYSLKTSGLCMSSVRDVYEAVMKLWVLTCVPCAS